MALLGLFRSGIVFHKKFEMARYGVRSLGWVTAKGGENSGLVYYAYRAGQQTYSGQYRLSDLDCLYTKHFTSSYACGLGLLRKATVKMGRKVLAVWVGFHKAVFGAELKARCISF